MRFLTHRLFVVFMLCASTFGISSLGLAQEKAEAPKLTSEAKQARDYSLRILDEMGEILREFYYDPKFHGVDLKQRIETAKARVKTMQYNWQMYRVLVQVLMEFNDSHTRMHLPARSDHFQYGVGWQMVGDECVVTSVKKGSDAAAKGVEVGDQVLEIGRYKPNRNDLWKIEYLVYKLDAQKTLDLKVKKVDGTEKTITIEAKTQTDKEYRADLKAYQELNKYTPFKCEEVSSELIACRLNSFVVEKNDIDKMMSRAHKYPKIILDLRGNGGGLVTIEEYLLSHFFDHEVPIASVITKEKTEDRVTKVLSADRQYKGEVSVLIDSDSASASEITARVLQIQKRAKIYGDFSSGSVMTSISVPFTSVMSALSDVAVIRVGMSVTIGDLVMSDGSRLEHTGVVPDEVLQPRGLALQQRMDVVLAYTAQKMGGSLTPEAAGKYYFIADKIEDNDSGPSDKKE